MSWLGRQAWGVAGGDVASAPGDVVDLGELDGQRAPEAAAVAGDEQAVAGAVEDVVGVLAERDGAAGREAGAALVPRRPASWETRSGGLRSSRRTTVEPTASTSRTCAAAHGRREAERALALDGGAFLAPGQLVLLGGRADLDEVRRRPRSPR